MESIVNTILATQSNDRNSLDSIYLPGDQDVCYVQQNNRLYRFFSDSTLPANGTTIVMPNNVPSGTAGRWFVQGPPGPGAKGIKPANLTTNWLPSSIMVDVAAFYSAGVMLPMANQPASSGSVVTDVQIPQTPLSGPLQRQVYRSGLESAFSIGGDTGPVTVNLEGGPLGYLIVDISWQASFNTTHNSANTFAFGVSRSAGGSHPQLPFVVRMSGGRFSVSCKGPKLIPGGGRDVSQTWSTYYGADALNSAELIVTAATLFIQDTGKRI